MNEEQLKLLENWIEAERACRRACKAAIVPGANPQTAPAALEAFTKTLEAGGKAFDMLKAVWGFGPVSA